jgi:anti-sigma B factor antagonist
MSLMAERGGMDLAVSSHESIPVLRVTGDIDMASAPALAAALEQNTANYRSPVLLDLTECSFVDSGGLNVLLQTVRQFDLQAWLGVLGANRNLRRIFEIVGLASDDRFQILDDLPSLS